MLEATHAALFGAAAFVLGVVFGVASTWHRLRPELRARAAMVAQQHRALAYALRRLRAAGAATALDKAFINKMSTTSVGSLFPWPGEN